MGVCNNPFHTPQKDIIIKFDNQDTLKARNKLSNQRVNSSYQINNKESEITKKNQINNSDVLNNMNEFENNYDNKTDNEKPLKKKNNFLGENINKDNSKLKINLSNKNLIKPNLDLELIEKGMKDENEEKDIIRSRSSKAVCRPIFSHLLKHSKTKEKIK